MGASDLDPWIRAASSSGDPSIHARSSGANRRVLRPKQCSTPSLARERAQGGEALDVGAGPGRGPHGSRYIQGVPRGRISRWGGAERGPACRKSSRGYPATPRNPGAAPPYGSGPARPTLVPGVPGMPQTAGDRTASPALARIRRRRERWGCAGSARAYPGRCPRANVRADPSDKASSVSSLGSGA